MRAMSKEPRWIAPLAGKILALLLCITASVSWAIDTYEFADETTRERFHILTEELRCPKCQNQNLADSNAPIAQDLRAEVYRLLSEGKSDREVKSYLVDRYGEYVLYKPEWSQQTWLLWLAPVILLLCGLSILVVIVRRRARKVAVEAPPPELNEQEQERIKQLLDSDSPGKDKES